MKPPHNDSISAHHPQKADFDPGGTLDDLLDITLNAALDKVNATAGSIMLLDPSGLELHIKTRLGLPRKRRVHVPAFYTTGESMGIAGHVAKSRTPFRTGNAERESKFKITQEGSLHFRSLLCVPIMANEDKVLGVINADHENEDKFSEQDQTELVTFCNGLAKVLAERISLVEALRRMTKKLTHETTEGDIKKTLRDIADNIRRALGADVVVLYQYNHIGSRFVLPNDGGPTISGDLRYPEYMKTPVYSTDVPYDILKQGKPLFISDMTVSTEETVTLKHRLPRKNQVYSERERFVIREGIKSVAALPLIHLKTNDIGEETIEPVGVLFVNYRHQRLFNIDEKAALELFTRAAAFAILVSRKEELSRKEKTGLFFRISDQAHVLLNEHNNEAKQFLNHFKGQEDDAFVISVDIRRSTELMLQAIDAAKFVQFISEVEKELKEAVKSNFGIVDKFTGDGLIAHFPEFFSGSDAGAHCLKAAEKCHEVFAKVYAEKHQCFRIVLSDVGLGIGIDYGKVHFRMTGEELIAVGIPVVYACRFSSIESGKTVINQQAADVLLKKYATQITTNQTVVDLKHQGKCLATNVISGAKAIQAQNPTWLVEAKKLNM